MREQALAKSAMRERRLTEEEEKEQMIVANLKHEMEQVMDAKRKADAEEENMNRLTA